MNIKIERGLNCEIIMLRVLLENMDNNDIFEFTNKNIESLTSTLVFTMLSSLSLKVKNYNYSFVNHTNRELFNLKNIELLDIEDKVENFRDLIVHYRPERISRFRSDLMYILKWIRLIVVLEYDIKNILYNLIVDYSNMNGYI